MTARVPDVETEVPPEGPAARCPHCGRPFPRERLRDLHVGEVHADAATPEEQGAYEAALDEEEDDLFVYHIKVVAALTVLYAGSVVGYMVVLAY